MSDIQHEEAHTGPIKTPKQLLWASIGAFVIPVFAIIGLVTYVTSANKPGAGASNDERSVAARIQKIGTVEVRDANRPLRSGEDVFKAQCTACHATGAAGAPKFQDAAAWAPRIKTGFDALVHSALTGKGAMAPQGGGDFNDIEIARGVVYMANAAGANFPVPDAPAAASAATASTASAATPAPASTTAVAAPAPAATAPAAAPAAATTNSAAGKTLYDQTCAVCHAAGVAGAPKFGDKAAWAPRIAEGMDAVYKIALTGKGAMPPKGGSAASDDDVRAAAQYMVDHSK